jgi:electron transport complex protein RnfA
MAGIRQENELAAIPDALKGAAMSFLIAGILSMAFMGFAGLFSATS